MSQLTQSLETRIQELKASIDAQKTELAAYEHVLQMELAKGTAPVEPDASETAVSGEAAETESAPAPSKAAADIAYSGNKTTMVAEIVKSYGATGATPKEVDAFFTAKNIQRSKNLIYNTLSYLVAQKKLLRREGKYFALGNTPTGRKKAAPAAATPTKRRLSPEGLKRIKEALKKRWAAKKAADAEAAKSAAPAKKKAAAK